MSDDAPSRSEEEGYYSEQAFIGEQYQATKEVLVKLQKMIDEGWTSDGEPEYILHIGPRERHLPVLAALLAEYLETKQAREFLTLPPGANLAGATVPDGSKHD